MSPSAVPHSWGIESWPESVWPHGPKRARYLVRAHRDDLLKAGCLSRVGRELVVHGPKFDRWLQRQAANVAGFEVAANRVT